MPWVRFNTESFTGEEVPVGESLNAMQEKGGAKMPCGGKKGGGKKPPKK